MSINITYLLGAGASFNALPIVEGIPNALNDFANEFHPGREEDISRELVPHDNLANKYYKSSDSLETRKFYYNKLKEFHNDILWLHKEAYNHTSIDTFAKKLYLQQDRDNLKRLKIILSCFFLYLQTKKFDKRYDSFFASILEDLSKLPNNLKILSWNYDSQLEIAFNRFANSTIENTRNVLNVFSKGQKTNAKPAKTNEFCVFKINGTTNVINEKNEIYDILLDFDVKEGSLVRELLELYTSRAAFKLHHPNMSFAWENFNEDSGFYKNLKESIRETEILVVIGYSFPFFNRKIDKLILDSMTKLKKVYVQDPNNSQDIIEKINGFFPNINKRSSSRITRKIDFFEKKFIKEFFIPIEF
ncbi:MAG: hypothetical protein ACM31G_00425 [Flavobacteriales bacterium]